MIISIETKNITLLKYCSIPIVGWILMFVIGVILPFAPGKWIADVLATSPEVAYNIYSPILGGGFMIAWNFFLQTKGVKIRLFFVPAWIWGIVFILIGISKIFGI